MPSFRSLRGVILGAVFVLTGCAGRSSEPGDFVLSPAYGLQGGPTTGSGGTNGLSPAAFHANVGALLGALGVAAADPGNPSAVNPAIVATGLLDTADGRVVFEYAARCALPAETDLESATAEYAGGGILSTTASWLTAGLTTSQKEDTLTCVIAHLNPFGIHVPIFLSGPSVAGAEDAESGGFLSNEAIWQVKLPGWGQPPQYHVWPLVNLLDMCELEGNATWFTRICDSPVNTCGVQVRYDRLLACTGSSGIFSCNGKPAIQTALQEGALCSLLTGPQ